MTTVTPTFQDQRWGPEPWAYFDYYQHPTADMVNGVRMNPLILVRHAGGGTAGDYTFYRTVSSNRLTTILRWLQDTTSLKTHFDYVSFTSGQQIHGEAANHVPPLPMNLSQRMYFPNAIFDCQRAIANIKHLWRSNATDPNTGLPVAGTYGFDPNKVLGLGESHGATLLGLSMMKPPLKGNGAQSAWSNAFLDPGTHDSTMKGVIYYDGQIDCRNDGTGGYGGTNYLTTSNFIGWFGVFDDTEMANIPPQLKDSCSLRAYFEKGDIANYRGLYTIYGNFGGGAKPYSNPHDPQQLTDINAAIAARGLAYGTDNFAANDFNSITLGPPVVATGTTLSKYTAMYNWLVAQIGGTP